MSLKKIAELTGVSISTVSRVLNSSSHVCAAPGTRDKIWAAAREIGYIPNENARALKLKAPVQGRSYSVSIISARFPDLDMDPFFHELFRSIEEELFLQDCHLSGLYNVEDVMSGSCRLPKKEGILLMGRCPNECLSYLRSEHKNIVGVGRNPTDYLIDEVICDGVAAALAAMEHLLSCSYKKIAYIGDCSYEARYLGYCQALITHKLPLDYSFVIQTGQTQDEGYQAMKKLLGMRKRPEAIFCANDITAIGVLNAYHDSKERGCMPAIISIDNIEAAQSTNPLLTTVNIPRQDMGRLAVALLLHRMEGKHSEAARINLPCRLILRESS